MGNYEVERDFRKCLLHCVRNKIIAYRTHEKIHQAMQEYFECRPSNDMYAIKISSPTCEDLGIPRDYDESAIPVFQTTRIIKNASLHIDGLRYEATIKGPTPKSDPFSPLSMIPLPTISHEQFEPSFVRKRNERERDRVRCVNDGYARLREHLPLGNKEKRISKVDTLRRAIDYIKHLESLLAESDQSEKDVQSCDILSDSESLMSSDYPSDTDTKGQRNKDIKKIEDKGDNQNDTHKAD